MHAFHSLSQQARFVACAGIALVAGAVDAAAPFTIDYPVAFATPTPQIAAGLKRISALKEYTESDDFQVATHDLNGDGVGEIIVQGSGSKWCGTGGCATTVLSRAGGKNVTLLQRNVLGTLVVTKESENGFRALAAADAGRILVDQKSGNQLVYLMQTAAAGEVAAAAPAAVSRPGGARPEMLGLKVGVSDAAAAKAALAALTPPIGVQEQYTKLIGTATDKRAFGQHMEVQGGNYLSHLRGTTQGFSQGCQGFSVRSASNCESVAVYLSGPPLSGTVFALSRQMLFANGPSVDTVMKSLREKYGAPGYVNDFGNRGTSFNLAWAWAADGSSIPMKEGHPCSVPSAARMSANATGQVEQAELYLKSRCAVNLHVGLGAANNVVSGMTLELADQAGILATSSKTVAFVSRSVSAGEQRERDAASKTAPPKY